jgi:hypothetical protein
MAFGWLKNKKSPYLGGGQTPGKPIKSQSLSEGWDNLKSEVGRAFDYFGGKKKKKKPGEQDGSAD